MDKKQLTEIITNVFKSLTPKKVSVFQKNEQIINIRVVSESFSGMTFSSRFKLLSKIIQEKEENLFNKYIFIFEAFTTSEVARIPKDGSGKNDDSIPDFKHSAKPLDI